MHVLVILGMGLTSVLTQITVLRRLLTVFSGNELVLGITLAVWLLAVGIGSFVGRLGMRSKSAFALSFVGIALLVQPTVLFIGHIHTVFGVMPGEVPSLAVTIVSTALSLSALCFVIGAQFPLSVAYRSGDAAGAYGLEAAGAFLGGVLFTFGLSGRVDAVTLALAISCLNMLIALVLFAKKRLIWLLLLPFILFFAIDQYTDYASDPDQEPVRNVESKYGEIAVYEAQNQVNVFSSGRFAFSYPDAQNEELKAHVPLSLLASPRKVLLIGGPPATTREFLKYPELSVDFVELDPTMIDVSLSLLTQDDRRSLNDARLTVIATDARRFIKTGASRYDLVVLNLPEPATANVNRFYTVEFFSEVKRMLGPGGILALSMPASHGYIGKRMQAANGAVYRSLRSVFAHTALSSEEYGGMYASDTAIDSNPELLSKRFSNRRIRTDYFHAFLFKDIFDPLKVNRVKTRLDQVDTVNRDQRPVAYLYNLMLWSDMYGGKFLNRLFETSDRTILISYTILLLIAIALFWRRKQAVYFSLFSAGYASMAFTMIVLLAYQASYGYVYERIGLLTALFMAGSAAGAYLARRLDRKLMWLKLIEIIAIQLFLAAPAFFNHEALYYALVLVSGVIGGAGFVVVNRLAEGTEKGRLAGRLYALELAGSVLGALLITLFFVPLLGVGNALLLLVLMKTASLALLFTVKKS